MRFDHCRINLKFKFPIQNIFAGRRIKICANVLRKFSKYLCWHLPWELDQICLKHLWDCRNWKESFQIDRLTLQEHLLQCYRKTSVDIVIHWYLKNRKLSNIITKTKSLKFDAFSLQQSEPDQRKVRYLK